MRSESVAILAQVYVAQGVSATSLLALANMGRPSRCAVAVAALFAPVSGSDVAEVKIDMTAVNEVAGTQTEPSCADSVA